jgi:hypothetical protein
MARELDEDELIGNWTLVGDELEQLSSRRGASERVAGRGQHRLGRDEDVKQRGCARE